ncbi:glucose 1-dehydrogenase [Metabacillus iocasae]|uniref:glucose 1-dehydrogenase [NAD(P)(+)] n=1 Tax=Priestia iocasae TaxID=2291674 RepID=A0ABS2QWF8_9BACI|nr:glucose 1-dehydrogenase [Metabacillus iocasae]MBM7703809.1 NAD(P)-dependent dehydrogenase (short-subunit alcohol dehydrogenase family) [Metabacillus iocasae]
MIYKGQVVVVTGAANGIGKEVSKQYAQKGARVLIADLDEMAGKEHENHIREAGGEATFVKTDVRSEQDVVNLMKEAVRTYGGINILINNAGVTRWKSPYDLSIEEWDDMININLRSVFLCSREAAKQMKQNEKGGSIVNVASTRASMSEPHTEAYAATKGGIVALTHALAISLGEDHITVNAVSPGWIETSDYEALRDIDHTQHPSQRVGKPSDIAKACLYLTHPENDFVTGTNLIVDGGMTRKMIYEH